MDGLVTITLVCAAVAAVIYRLKLLTFRGAFSAFLIAVFIWSTRGFAWVAVLLLFFAIGSAATRWRYGQKEKTGVAEARKGKRSIENVIGSAYAPMLFVVFSSPIGFLASVAAGLADNLASEIGSTSKRVRLITNLRRVPAGTDGGISMRGELATLVGSALMALTAPLLGVGSWSTIFVIFFAGFMGSTFDSLLGATLERRGLVGKTEVNVAATLFGGLFALALVHFGVDVYLEAYLPLLQVL